MLYEVITNIMVRADGYAKVVDFGLARSVGGDGDGLTELPLATRPVDRDRVLVAVVV